MKGHSQPAHRAKDRKAWNASGPPLVVRLAALQFRRQRVAYYEFLSELLDSQTLEQTLLLTFEQDSWRHGNGTTRGRLAEWWAKQYQATGGRLAQSWAGTLPESDLQSIALAEQAGQAALVQTLRSLATQIRLWQDCTAHFWQTVAVGLVACLVAMTCLFVLPLWTVPRLMSAFASVPSDYYGPAVMRLLGWVDLVRTFWSVFVVVCVGMAVALWWSFVGLVGKPRAWLDRFGLWRLYRDLNAMRFLTGSATLLNALSASGVSLKTVLTTQQRYAGAWLSSHLWQMIRQIDAGADPLTAMNTGLLAGDVWWRFVDVVRVRGLAQGLGTASESIGQIVKVQMARRAVVLRWGLLGAAMAGVMAMGLWHLRAIEQLRQGLTLFYSLSG